MKRNGKKLAIIMAIIMVIMMIPTMAFADVETITVNQPSTIVTQEGSLVQVDLNSIFTDEEGHSLTYTLSETAGERYTNGTKIVENTFYFTSPDEGVYHPIITATCAEASADVVITIDVEPAEDGLPCQYDYDETPAGSVRVYVTLSSDGVPLIGNDSEHTVLSHLEVNVPYFDLAEYGLQDYYRYASVDGSYVGEEPIHRPTAMHAFIYLLERYYMGIDEEDCGTGLCNPVGEAGGYGAENMFFETAYDDYLDCVYYTGSAQSTYMQNFWGHDENLMYYRNHAYPLQSAGWGATSDYILLSTGDTLDIAMFSDWGFWMNGAFACFGDGEGNNEPVNTFEVEVGETFGFTTLKFGTQSVADGGVDDFLSIDELEVVIYDEYWNEIEWLGSGSDYYEYTFEDEGTYYIIGLDSNFGNPEAAAIAPATAKVIVL